MALIIGASWSLQSKLSEHTWVHIPISRQNSGMPGGVLKHGDLVLTRDYVEHILSPQTDDADLWRILQIAVWAFRAYVGLHANFPPKFRYDRGGPQTRRFGPHT